MTAGRVIKATLWALLILGGMLLWQYAVAGTGLNTGGNGG